MNISSTTGQAQEVQQQFSSALQQQLYELLVCLHQLGMEFPQILIQLAGIVQPSLTPEMLVPVIRKTFEEIPSLLQQSPQQLQKMVLDPPDSLTFKLLLDFRELQQLLQQISYLQLLHLSNNLIPPGPLPQQLDFLQKAQEQFQSWTQESLQNLHQVLSETPLHMERQQLLQLEPQIPWELLHFLIELIKLPLEELYGFQDWISKLPKKQLLMMIHLLQMEPSALIEIKRRIDIAYNSSQVEPYNVSTTDSTESNYATTVNPNRVSAVIENATNASSQLRIVRQPPSRTVYQRILKPFPSVMLVGSSSDQATNNLFVEASLLRSDSEAELPLCIEGNRVVRISNGVFATFKKLKILSTSQQQGTLFRIKFTLKKYVGNVFEPIHGAVIISNPIEVFSHTLYLTEKQEAPPPAVYEVLPPTGKGGTRVVILGSNFVNSPQLRVRFGSTDITATFHEQGTLICTIPPTLKPELGEGGIPVRVSNDGANFCETKVFFTFIQT